MSKVLIEKLIQAGAAGSDVQTAKRVLLGA